MLKTLTPAPLAGCAGGVETSAKLLQRIAGERVEVLKTGCCGMAGSFGFTRSRNGTASMHAVLSVATVMGAWQHAGGGAMHSQGGIYHWDKTVIEGLDVRDLSVRNIDQSRIGPAISSISAGAAPTWWPTDERRFRDSGARQPRATKDVLVGGADALAFDVAGAADRIPRSFWRHPPSQRSDDPTPGRKDHCRALDDADRLNL